ncbi:MAG: hypothetical protein U0230_23355 [Polyangiales bacterium]
MARQKGFAFAVGQAPYVVLTWDYGYSDARVQLEGRELGVVKTKAELERGRTFALADGGALTIRLSSAWLAPTWVVTLGETPLVPADGNPERDASWARGVMALNAALGAFSGIGMLALAFGAADTAVRSEELVRSTLQLIVALLFGAGFLLARRDDRRGYTLGLATCGAVLAWDLWRLAQDGPPYHVNPLIVLAVVFVLIVRGRRGHDALFPA